MQEILDLIGTIGDTLGNFLLMIIDLFTFLGDNLLNGFQFIITIITYIPNLLVDSIFVNLAPVFRLGLSSLFSVILFLFAVKIFQLVKFW